MAKKTEAQIRFEAITKPYSDGIKDMNMANKTLQNDLKLNSTELKGNADDVELLQKRQELLEQESQNTTQKIKMLEASLKDAEAMLGKNSKEYYNLTNDLIRAKTQEAAIKNEIKQTTDAIEEQQYSTQDLDETIDDLGESLEDTKENVSVFGDVLKANLASDSIKNGIEELGSFVYENGVQIEQSVNQVVGALGLGEDSAERFENVMDQIYRDNYGENFEDIAAAVQEVSMQLDDLDDEQLIKTTESALTLRDTFGFDVNEQVRAAKMMMDQFGISSDQAFNLITQGAQNGLDKNGDLLDTINEYSVHFKQIGLDADDMFNILLSGADAGTFSVDKLGDAVKEFGIRIKDGTADDTLKQLGLDVDEVKQKFALGGEAGKEAFQEINNALFDVSDTNEQFKLGVSMYGTMFEDLGSDGIEALSNLEGAIDSNNDSMDQLKSVKYDDLMSQIEELKRGFEQDIGGTLTNTVFPVLSELITWVGQNKDLIEILAIGIGAGALAFGIATTAVALYNGVMDIMALSTGTATVATTGLGAAFTFLTSPIGIITLAIGGVVAAGVALYKNWDTVCQWASRLGSTISNIWNGIKDTITNKINDAKTAVSTAIDKIKGFFDFSWELPKLKMPHISITGSFSLKPLSVPHFNIEWYAKGALFKGPTVIQNSSGNFNGFGEAGPEYALPLNNTTMEPIASMLADKLNVMNQPVAQELYADIEVYVGDDLLVEKVSKKIALRTRRERG